MFRLCHPRVLVISLLILVLVLGTVFGACAKPAPAPAPAPKPAPAAASPSTPAAKAPEASLPKKFTIVSTSATGTLYVIASAIADMTTKYVKVTGSVETAGGSVAATKVLGQGQADMATLTGIDLPEAFYGTGSQEKPVEIRGVMRGHAGVFQLMTRADSGIKTVSDISGRKFQFVKVGSINHEYGYTLIKCANLKDVKELPGGGSQDSSTGLSKGTIDVGVTSSIGAGEILELVSTRDVNFIPLPENVRDCMVQAKRGYLKKPIPKGTYQTKGGLPKDDIPAIGYDSWIATRADASEELVYQIVKAVLDHPEEFAIYHAEAKYYNLKSATGDPQIPFHPGAIRYYKEKGVWTDALQKFQDKLLAEAPKSK